MPRWTPTSADHNPATLERKGLNRFAFVPRFFLGINSANFNNASHLLHQPRFPI